MNFRAVIISHVPLTEVFAFQMYQYQWPWRVLFFESFPIIGARRKTDKKALLVDVGAQVKANPAAGAVRYFDSSCLPDISIFKNSDIADNI